MTISTDRTPSPIWMPILVALAILFSFAMSCGMPFAALGALAALTLRPRDALVLVGLGWIANQAVGFGFLGYPFTAMTFAWGAAIGLSALAAAGMAILSLRVTAAIGFALRALVALATAYLAQQGTIYAASFVLPSSPAAFAPSVLWDIAWTNALAFAVLIGAQWIGARAGLARPLTQAA